MPSKPCSSIIKETISAWAQGNYSKSPRRERLTERFALGLGCLGREQHQKIPRLLATPLTKS